MTKQEQIKSLKQELVDAYEQINNLKKKANDDFSVSSEFDRMQQEIKSLKLMQSLEEKHIESEIRPIP